MNFYFVSYVPNVPEVHIYIPPISLRSVKEQEMMQDYENIYKRLAHLTQMSQPNPDRVCQAGAFLSYLMNKERS